MEENIKRIYQIADKIYIPKELLKGGEYIMHISDTPECIFNKIYNLIDKIKPRYIIHTGDIVDNIKLEFHPEMINEYEKKAQKFIDKMSSGCQELIISLGNHDNLKNIRIPKNTILYEKGEVNIAGLKLCICHYADFDDLNCDYYLYGHYKREYDRNRFLNGVNYINIINIKTKIVERLLYPYTTDFYRYRKGKLGI